MLRVADLVARVPRLSLTATEPLLSSVAADAEATMLAAMDTAWDDIEDYLRQKGQRSHLITTSYDLRGVHLAHTLEVLLMGVASSLGGQYRDMGLDYQREYREKLRDLSLNYAPADGSSSGKRSGAMPPLFAGGAWEAPEPYSYQQGYPGTRRGR